MTRRTSARLADGREIIYFDDSEHAERVLHDPRVLPPTATTSEIRYDPLMDDWVAVASHRQDRIHLPPSEQCPLCPSRPGQPTEIPSPDYDVVVFENRFPTFASVRTDNVDPYVDGESLFARRPGVGRCEVVCFTSDHDASFSMLKPSRVRTVLDALADRTAELSRMPGIAQVFPFENRGPAIGVTLHHPHGQIYGYPFVTPHTRRMLESARSYHRRTMRNLFADVLAAEQRAGTRIIASGRYWTAFVPAAARWPVEVHLYPHRRVADLPGLTEPERDELAHLYLDVLQRFDNLHGTAVPYIAAWHQSPVEVGRDLAYLHIAVFSIQRGPGKLKYLAGSESGMGAWISDVLPEETARRLREAGS